MSTFPQTDVALNGVILGSNAAPNLYSTGALGRIGLNPRGDTRVAYALKPSTELIRQGASFSYLSDQVAYENAALPAGGAGATAHTIFNNFPLGGRHLVFDVIGNICGTSVAAATQLQIIMCPQLAASTATTQGTVNTQATIKNLYTCTSGAYGNAIFGHGGNTASTEIWQPIGPNYVTALTTTIGMGMFYKCLGEVILAPQQQLNFSVVAASNTGLGAMYYLWHEVQLS